MKEPASLLDGYDASDFHIQWTDQAIRITNQFDEVPVQYAWYVIYEGETIVKQGYDMSTNEYEYTFKKPGMYKIQANV